VSPKRGDWVTLPPRDDHDRVSGRRRPVLFTFGLWRSSILLVAGDKAGQWNAWYSKAIPLAEQRYEIYLKERRAEEEGRS
jgi:hypothetical protein